MYTYNQLKQIIKAQKLQVYKMYNGTGECIDAYNVQKQNNTDGLITHLDHMIKFLPNDSLKFVGRKGHGNGVDQVYYFNNKHGVDVDSGLTASQMNGTTPINQPIGETAKQMEERITATIMNGIKEKSLAEREKEIEEQHKALETFAGKASVVFEMLVEKFLQKQPLAAPLQGEQSAQLNVTDMQFKPPMTLQDFQNEQVWNQEKQVELNQAFEVFVKMMHPDYIVKIAKEIDDDPKMVQRILNYLV